MGVGGGTGVGAGLVPPEELPELLDAAPELEPDFAAAPDELELLELLPAVPALLAPELLDAELLELTLIVAETGDPKSTGP